jgi:hypothetical protein
MLVNIYDTIIVVGDRNTGTHHAEAHIVDSSTKELEQSNAAYDIVDSSADDIEQSNAALKDTKVVIRFRKMKDGQQKN